MNTIRCKLRKAVKDDPNEIRVIGGDIEDDGDASNPGRENGGNDNWEELEALDAQLQTAEI